MQSRSGGPEGLRVPKRCECSGLGLAGLSKPAPVAGQTSKATPGCAKALKRRLHKQFPLLRAIVGDEKRGFGRPRRHLQCCKSSQICNVRVCR